MKSHDVVDYFIARAEIAGKRYVGRKLALLAYIADGYSLARRGKPLLSDDERFCAGKSCPMPEYLRGQMGEHEYITGPISIDPALPSSEDEKILDEVYTLYGSAGAEELRALFMGEGSPWAEAQARDDTGLLAPRLNDELIRAFFYDKAGADKIKKQEEAARRQEKSRRIMDALRRSAPGRPRR